MRKGSGDSFVVFVNVGEDDDDVAGEFGRTLLAWPPDSLFLEGEQGGRLESWPDQVQTRKHCLMSGLWWISDRFLGFPNCCTGSGTCWGFKA